MVATDETWWGGIVYTFDRAFCLLVAAGGAGALIAGVRWDSIGLVLLGLPQVAVGGLLLLLSLRTHPVATQPAAAVPGFRVWTVLAQLGALVTAVVLCWVSLDDLARTPPALSNDEVMIGLRSRELLVDAMPTLDLPLFYLHFSYDHFGSVPLFASAPFIALFGLEPLALRIAAVFWSMLAVLALLLTFRRLGWRHGWVAVAAFALSPMALHVSRLNMAHTPTLFLTFVALYAFVRARDDRSLRWTVAAGFTLGATAYGMAAWYFAAPIMLGAIGLGELVVGPRDRVMVRRVIVMVAAFTTSWLPIFNRLLTDPGFLERMSDKSRTDIPLFSWERLGVMRDNWSKYFELDYLFVVGEIGAGGYTVLRHAVPGAGTFPWVMLPLLVLGLAALLGRRGGSGTGAVLAVAGVVLLVLLPLPDIITTTSLDAPYTFALYPMFIGAPLVAGFGIDWLARALEGRPRAAWLSPVLALLVAGVLVTGAVRFATGPWERYPMISADFWGWQYGAEAATVAFQERRDEYDRFLFDSDFHHSALQIDFYLYDDPELRARTDIGFAEGFDLDVHQLGALRAERLDGLLQTDEPIRRYLRVVGAIPYPNGDTVLYLVDIDSDHDTGAPVNW